MEGVGRSGGRDGSCPAVGHVQRKTDLCSSTPLEWRDDSAAATQLPDPCSSTPLEWRDDSAAAAQLPWAIRPKAPVPHSPLSQYSMRMCHSKDGVPFCTEVLLQAPLVEAPLNNGDRMLPWWQSLHNGQDNRGCPQPW